MPENKFNFFVNVLGTIEGLEKSLNSGLRSVRTFARDAGGSLAAVGGSITGALTAIVKFSADTGDALLEMSQRTGISVESLSEFAYVGKLSGITLEEIEKATRGAIKSLGDFSKTTATNSDKQSELRDKISRLRAEYSALASSGGDVTDRMKSTAEEIDKLKTELEETDEATTKYDATLRALSIRFAEFDAMNPEAQFQALLEAVAAVQDPTDRARLAMEVFGDRVGTKLLPMLAEGTAELGRLREEARTIGAVMSTEDAQAADEWNDSLVRLGATWQGIRNAIAFSLIEELDPLLDRVQRNVQGIRAWMNANPELTAQLARITAAIGGVSFALGTFLLALLPIGSAIGKLFTLLGFLFSPIGLLTALVIASLAVVTTKWIESVGGWGEALKIFKETLNETWADIKSIFGTLWPDLMEGFKTGDWEPFWDDLYDYTIEFWERLKGAAGKFFDWLGDKLTGWYLKFQRAMTEGAMANRRRVTEDFNNFFSMPSSDVGRILSGGIGAPAAFAGPPASAAGSGGLNLSGASFNFGGISMNPSGLSPEEAGRAMTDAFINDMRLRYGR